MLEVAADVAGVQFRDDSVGECAEYAAEGPGFLVIGDPGAPVGGFEQGFGLVRDRTVGAAAAQILALLDVGEFLGDLELPAATSTTPCTTEPTSPA